jgi:hypothetical protein
MVSFIKMKVGHLGTGRLGSSWMESEVRGLAVLCINCEDYVEVQEINVHSSVCFRVTRAVIDSSRYHTLELSRLKLKRLGQLLKTTAAKAGSATEKNYLSVMLRICEQSASLAQYSEVEALEQHQKTLQSVTTKHSCSIGTQLCSDRLKSLVCLHRDTLVASDVQDGLETTVGKLKVQLRSYQELSEKLELDLALKKHLKLDKITSEVHSGKSSFISSASSTDGQSEGTLTPSHDYAETPGSNEAQRKRLFYSACLACKTMFPSSHPARRVPILKLFCLAEQQDIPSDKWKLFITEYFESLLPVSFIAQSASIRAITESDELDGTFC